MILNDTFLWILGGSGAREGEDEFLETTEFIGLDSPQGISGKGLLNIKLCHPLISW